MNYINKSYGNSKKYTPILIGLAIAVIVGYFLLMEEPPKKEEKTI